MKFYSLLLVFVLSSFYAISQDITGTWGGAIKTDSVQVLIYMHITRNTDNSLNVNYDLPSHNQYSVPFPEAIFGNNTLNCLDKVKGISYEAGIRSEEFNGVWRQAGRSASLNLVRMDSHTE